MAPKKKRRPTRKAVGTDGAATRQRFIELALELIEHNGGCRGVNLRTIAARAGCAHTNLYNYFVSLEALFWAAVDHALERVAAYTRDTLEVAEGREGTFAQFLAVQFDYSREHPSLYRLVWLEPLEGEPPPAVLQRLDAMRQLWIRQIMAHMKAPASPAIYAWAGQIIHGYFHGELCKLIGRRTFVPPSEDARARIIGNTLRLAELVATSAPPAP